VIRDESEQKIVLERALEVGFDTADLCRDVFERFKNKYPIRLEELADDNRVGIP
jgi:hypothetical protein